MAFDSSSENNLEPLLNRKGIDLGKAYRVSGEVSGATFIQVRFDTGHRSHPYPHINVEHGGDERGRYPDIPNHVPVFGENFTEQYRRAKEIDSILKRKYKGEISLEELLKLVPETKDPRVTWPNKINPV